MDAVTVASHDYFDEKVPHPEAVCLDADRLAAEGKTVMMVCHDGNVCAIFWCGRHPQNRER